jgi:hypothetical protein
MITVHPREARVLAQEQVNRLRSDAVRTAVCPSALRRSLAAWLQHAAKRLDPAALAPRIA